MKRSCPGRLFITAPTLCQSGTGRVFLFLFLHGWLALPVTSSCAAETRATGEGLASEELTDVASPPEWALWERHLLDHFRAAALEFVPT